MTRRAFLATSTIAAAPLATVRAQDAPPPPDTEPHRGPNRIGVSSYSFWEFQRQDLRDLHTNLEHAARMGFDGLEILQAKTYFGGSRWYTLDLDYARIATIMKDAGFAGYVSLEFEGKEDPLTAIPQSLELLRKHFA